MSCSLYLLCIFMSLFSSLPSLFFSLPFQNIIFFLILFQIYSSDCYILCCFISSHYLHFQSLHCFVFFTIFLCFSYSLNFKLFFSQSVGFGFFCICGTRGKWVLKRVVKNDRKNKSRGCDIVTFSSFYGSSSELLDPTIPMMQFSCIFC